MMPSGPAKDAGERFDTGATDVRQRVEETRAVFRQMIAENYGENEQRTYQLLLDFALDHAAFSNDPDVLELMTALLVPMAARNARETKH
jgi:hypothetical protein